MFKTKDCDEVDVCNLAKMVDAIADGLGNDRRLMWHFQASTYQHTHSYAQHV